MAYVTLDDLNNITAVYNTEQDYTIQLSEDDPKFIAYIQTQFQNKLISDITAAIQNRLDNFARTRNYDDIKSLSDYAGDTDPIFNSEGSYGKSLRSQTWRTAITILEDIKAGRRPLPSGYEDLAPELPEMRWPT